MFQKWFLFRCISFFFLTFLAFAEVPPLLKEVESKYLKAGRMQADFVQENENVTFGQKKRSSGKVSIKQPLKVRWETFKPFPSLLIGNGRMFWFYTPPFEKGERGQVIQKESSIVQSKLAHALLSGNFSLLEQAKMMTEKKHCFTIIPKFHTAGSVEKATLDIDPDTKLIRRVLLVHEGGNRSEISLSKIELGSPLSEDLFQFKIPSNTDRIDGDIG